MTGETVLIADDPQLMCDRLEDELMQLGVARCIKAPDGQEAVKAYQENDIDLVFLDIGMPVLDGLQALQLLKSLNPEVHLVMASGTSLVDKVKTAIMLGAKGFMVKPYSSEKVRETLRNYRGSD